MAPPLFLAVIYTGKDGRLLITLIRDWSKDYLSLPCTLELHAVCRGFREISVYFFLHGQENQASPITMLYSC